MFGRNRVNSINVNDLENLLGKINLLDIREEYEYASGRVPTTQNIPMGQLLSQSEKYLNKSDEYHIICQSGGRSSRACEDLASKGYNVVNVFGGTGSYIRPLER